MGEFDSESKAVNTDTEKILHILVAIHDSVTNMENSIKKFTEIGEEFLPSIRRYISASPAQKVREVLGRRNGKS